MVQTKIIKNNMLKLTVKKKKNMCKTNNFNKHYLPFIYSLR